VSIDLVPEEEPSRSDAFACRQRWMSWPRVDQIFQMIEADSHSPATANAVQADQIDLLFLDGDHTYEGVKADWDLWSPLVRPGGIIAFHDTVETEWAHEPGVVRLVSELKKQHSSVEWFDARNGGVGITAFLLGL
jgi:predicted O-methyltransferase YrrM